ncbi:serine/threonine-protein kinase [Methanobrevibacter sp. DSM 116169]|uniref:serine/threonine-protein kinase n=1 Tax=Methanobrevibacter sp. DSM 116169 TaxID=3242727 RepID=UPI0038FC68FF
MNLLDINDELGGYRIIDFIGEGAFGEVYHVKGPLGDKALKIIKKPRKNKPSDEIINEIYTLGNISHENIITIHCTGSYKIGECFHDYFIMEYGGKGNLSNLLKNYYSLDKHIPLDKVLDIIKQICSGMKKCHEHDDIIIHKDIKLENVLLTLDKFGRICVKISDFGSASSNYYYDDGIQGTIRYVPPDDNLNSPKRDVYAIGVLFYKLLTNNFPYDVEGVEDIVSKKPWNEKPISPSEINPDCYKGIDEIVLKAINKDVKKRYGDAGSLLKDIENWENQSLKVWLADGKFSVYCAILGLVIGLFGAYITNYFILIFLIPLISAHISKHSYMMSIVSMLSLFIFIGLFGLLNFESNIYTNVFLFISSLIILYSYNAFLLIKKGI